MYVRLPLFAALLLAPPALASPPCASLAEIDAGVNVAAAAFMERYAVPGMSIGVANGEQQRFYSFGVTSKQSGVLVTPDTLFELGSISTTFTATLATYSAARGKLSLDDLVGKHVPDLGDRPIAEIPLWRLATHTGGAFPLHFPNQVRSEADALRYYQQWSPSPFDSKQRSYGDPPVALLGMVTAKSLELSFVHAMEGDLLPKLGLTNTWLRVPMVHRKNYAQGYNAAGIPVRLTVGPLGEQVYGIRSSARDLLRFVQLNIRPVTGDPALDSALLATHVARFKVGPMYQGLIWEQYRYPVAMDDLAAGNSDHMAYNANPIDPISADRAADGDWLLNKTGNTAGFASYAAFVPSRGLGVVILTNKSHSNEGRIRLAYALLQLLQTTSHAAGVAHSQRNIARCCIPRSHR